METFKKYWQLIVAVIGVFVGVFGWFYEQGSKSQDLNGRTFDSPEQKVEHIKHVEQSLSPKQQQRKYILDSINLQNAIKSRKRRDSLWMEEHKARMITDSINKLNADQLFQIKEELRQLKSQQ